MPPKNWTSIFWLPNAACCALYCPVISLNHLYYGKAPIRANGIKPALLCPPSADGMVAKIITEKTIKV
jgi:hypothetical protein